MFVERMFEVSICLVYLSQVVSLRVVTVVPS